MPAYARLRRSPLRSFSSDFAATENPISEGGAWENTSVAWTNVRTTGGNAIGTMTTSDGFADSVARITGNWAPNQRIEGVAYRGAGTISGFVEIELHVRMSMSANFITTYEMNVHFAGSYVDFIKWGGPLGNDIGDFDFIVPSETYSLDGPVVNGDQFALQIVGNTLNGYIKRVGETLWTPINSSPVVDPDGAGGTAEYPTGKPGIGYFTSSDGVGLNLFGWQSVYATEIA